MKKIAYVPMSSNYSAPGDRRRFCSFLKNKKIDFEFYDKNKIYDVIVISQNADLSYWANFKKGKTKIIFDFCDAYLFEELSFRKVLRGIGKYITKQNVYLNFNYVKLIKKVCSNSDAIICTTEAQKNKLLKYCNNVEIILDTQENEISPLVKADIQPMNNKSDKLNIFWEGQAGNLNSLNKIIELLNEFLSKDLINIFFLTDKKSQYFSRINIYRDTNKILKNKFKNSKNVFLIEWNKENLSRIGKKCDIGIIPVINHHNGMYAHKPANKLHLMWRLGLPVLASPTPAIIRSNEISGINLLCYKKKDWIKFINFFLKNKQDIQMISNKLKIVVKENFSDDKEFKKWDLVFEKINSPI
jgi:hypothetical protein